MDHGYIEEHGLIDRYRQGLLAPDEEARFEEHFVGCADCTRELELARAFARGVHAMAAEDAAAAAAAATLHGARVAVAAGLFAWLARRGRPARAAAGLLVLLLAAAIPAAWLAGRRAWQDGHPATGAADAAAYRQRWQAEHGRAEDLGRRLQAAEAARTAERARLEAQLAAAARPQAGPGTLQGPGQGSRQGAGPGRERIAGLGQGQDRGAVPRQDRSAGLDQGQGQGKAGSAWTRPLLDAPLVLLHTFRDEPAKPTVITAEQAAGPLSIALDVGDAGDSGDSGAAGESGDIGAKGVVGGAGEPAAPSGAGRAKGAGSAGARGAGGASFGIQLRTAAGSDLLRREGLHPNALGVLMITFPPGFLAAGDYRLTVTAIAAGGARTPAGSYALKVAAAGRAPAAATGRGAAP